MISPTMRTVMVTGANGYLASHIVKQLLDHGYNVNACVRNANNESSIRHLMDIKSTGTLNFFSTGDMGDTSLTGRYKMPLTGCDAVIHSATPLSPKVSGRAYDGKRDMLNPGIAGTQELLESIIDAGSVSSIQCLILTSSMSAAAPRPEPNIKDESHWSDDNAQLADSNYYGCLKTRQERMCHEWFEKQKEQGKLSERFRFVAICPTMIIGPPVLSKSSYIPTGTMGSFYRWLTERKNAPNDSMSFIHVEDCAAMHIAALENTEASGRYFSLVESWHWNDILNVLKELHPNMPDFKVYEGIDKVIPTQYNLSKMNSLGVEVKGLKTIFKDSVNFFTAVGLL